MSTSASSTLTAAMMPSSRFVVPSSPAMSSSEWRRLPRTGVAWRQRSFAEGVVEQLPTLAGDTGGLLDGRSEAHELAREVIERRLELPTQGATVVGEEQVTGDASDHRTDDRGGHCPRVVHRPSYQNRLQVVCHAVYDAPQADAS